MKTVSEQGFDAMLTAATAEIVAIAHALRDLIGDVHPEAVEVVWPVQGSAGYGFGPKKNSEQYVYIYPHGKHVNLGFYYGVALPDPAGLLAGTGKKLRHVKVFSAADAQKAELRAVIVAAKAERAAALGLD